MSDLREEVKRTFIIGDEWLYYKLYCGPKIADIILTEVIKPVTEKLLDQGIIDKWFFIRYSDPQLHLRLRFHFVKEDHFAEVIKALNNHLNYFIKQDLVYKVQIDTYKRELERYGKNNISMAEELFFHDSVMIVSFIDLIEGDEGELVRWLFALRAIDSLLNNFCFKEKFKLHLMRGLKENFGKEFEMNKMLKLQLDRKFRANRKLITDIFNGNYKREDVSEIFELLDKKSNSIKYITDELLKLDQMNCLDVSLSDLVCSYVHMLLNRLFKSKQRIHEMVIYDFLYRYYKSEIAKSLSTSKKLLATNYQMIYNLISYYAYNIFFITDILTI
jgi:thiopeptide-type bacteriocin biosynthesis protein